MPAFTDLIRAIAGAHRRRNRYTVLYTIGCLCAHWSTSEIAAADTNRTISGMATVVSGDTIEIDGQRMRFHGVDAPEISQTCRTDDGTEWACGKRAFEALITLTNNKSIRCDVHTTALNTTRVATCHNRRGLDLGAEMISNCLARAVHWRRTRSRNRCSSSGFREADSR